MMKRFFWTIVLLLAGCAAVDYDSPRQISTFIPVGNDTELDQKISPLISNRPANVSGFYVLTDGIDAIAARLRLAAEAERSIDIQYYLIKRDQVGNAFLNALLSAADRGVRVRLLLDDMFNKGFDQGMLALNAHPNFEIRVFNPFNRGGLGRSVGAALDFRRINRRMHNKSFTVDNRVTIIGGRNIADEYFGARQDSAFGDLDVIGFGPIVQDVTDMFDTYWQHETAVPLAGFLKPLEEPQIALDAYREQLRSATAELSKSDYAVAVIDRAYAGIQKKTASIRWSAYRLIYDPPDKGIKNRVDESEMIIAPLIASLSKVEKEVMIISPYFVPRTRLMQGLKDASASGIQVSIITNSLAANNQKTVHGGYAPARKPLLKAGVRLYEIRPDARVPGTEFVDASSARATLHTKAFVIDRRKVFIGSFNFDPRSAFINTEMGVIIDDPQLGADFVAGLESALPGAAWEVYLNDKNRVAWKETNGDATTHNFKEPMTNWWQRFKAGVYRLLPIRSQL